MSASLISLYRRSIFQRRIKSTKILKALFLCILDQEFFAHMASENPFQSFFLHKPVQAYFSKRFFVEYSFFGAHANNFAFSHVSILRMQRNRLAGFTFAVVTFRKWLSQTLRSRGNHNFLIHYLFQSFRTFVIDDCHILKSCIFHITMVLLNELSRYFFISPSLIPTANKVKTCNLV